MATDTTDIEALKSVAEGDRAGMKLLYDRYSDGLNSFALNWLSDPFEASDVVHETMLEVWRSAGKFAGKSSVKTWIFSIARNKSIDRNRKAVKSVVGEIDETIQDSSLDPEAVTSAFEDVKRVRACIDSLSPAHKSVIHLAFYEDLTYGEISNLEGSPVGTIKTRIMHAKRLLMRCLGQ